MKKTKTINIAAIKINPDGSQTQTDRTFTRKEVLRITGIPSSTLAKRENLLREICPEFEKVKGSQIYTVTDIWILLFMRDFISEKTKEVNPTYAIQLFKNHMTSCGLPLEKLREFKQQVKSGEIEL